MERMTKSGRGIRVWLSVSTIVGATMLWTGCSSVAVVDSGRRGLFQSTEPHFEGGAATVGIPAEKQGTGRSTGAQRYGVTGSSESGFAWPLSQGRVSSKFGKRRRDFHEGIDIRCQRGTPIMAARDGRVIYSSRRIGGYGNMIVIQHEDGMATVYAHNKKNLVRVGDFVRQGSQIALVGATGKATGPHLHFEIRQGEVAQDPLNYLPQVAEPSVAQLGH